jgi:hypothetical protein
MMIKSVYKNSTFLSGLTESLTRINLKRNLMRPINFKGIVLVWGVAFAPLVYLPSPLHATATLGSLTLTKVAPRIFTPNGDGFNDKARLEFDNPEQLPITGTVYDLAGARVADLKPGSDPNSVLLWDGKDGDGQTVAGGIYIYQVVFEGKTATGTVVVAR